MACAGLRAPAKTMVSVREASWVVRARPEVGGWSVLRAMEGEGDGEEGACSHRFRGSRQ